MGQWLQCIGKSVEKLPSYDGFLETQLSGMRVPFHVIRSDSTPWDAKQAYSLALLGARMSCDAIDIFRGRQKPAHVERILTEDCMRRLKIAASIIGHYMKEDANLYAKIGLLPINVSAITLVDFDHEIRMCGFAQHRRNAVEMQHRIQAQRLHVEVRLG